jgi:hypothetical protein
MITRPFVPLVMALLIGVPAQSQTSSAARATELAHSFNKSKHAVKSKRGVRKEKFKEVIVEPRPVSQPEEYSGSYADQSGLDAALDLAIDSTGRGAGWGKDPALDGKSAREFTLENVRVDGALLTATKRYHTGGVEPFEAVFVTRSDRDHPDSVATRSIGIGIKLYRPVRMASSINVERVFLKRTDS